MKSKINWLIINLISLAAISLVIAINLNSRLVDQENKIKDMEWTIQEHELSIQRLAEQNAAQDTIKNIKCRNARKQKRSRKLLK